MSSSLKSFLPIVLATSPLLISAAEPTDPNTAQISCKLGISDTVPIDTTVEQQGYIVQPVSSALQALVTSAQEFQTFDQEYQAFNTTAETPAQNHCNYKEEPAADSVEEEGETATEEFPTEIPNLDPSVLSDPPSETPSALPSDSSDSPTDSTADTADTVDTAAPSEETSADPSPATTTTQDPPAAIPARPTATPPSDPSVDPRNFTPTTDAPAPFDGIVIPTLSALPDGSYRYLSGNYEYGVYTDEQLIANGGSIFLLTKVGNQVTGHLLPRVDQPGICVTGTVTDNTIEGAAYAMVSQTTESPDAAAEAGSEEPEVEIEAVPEAEAEERKFPDASEAYEPYSISALQVRKGRTVADRMVYDDVVLDLSEYSRINAGSAIAPTECNIPATDTETTEVEAEVEAE